MFQRLPIAVEQEKQEAHLKNYLTKYGNLYILCIEQKKKIIKMFITV